MNYGLIEAEFISIFSDLKKGTEKRFNDIESYGGEYDGLTIPEKYTPGRHYIKVQVEGTTYDRTNRLPQMSKGDIDVRLYLGDHGTSIKKAKAAVYDSVEAIKLLLSNAPLTVSNEFIGKIFIASDLVNFVIANHVSWQINLIITTNTQHENA